MFVTEMARRAEKVTSYEIRTWLLLSTLVNSSACDSGQRRPGTTAAHLKGFHIPYPFHKVCLSILKLRIHFWIKANYPILISHSKDKGVYDSPFQFLLQNFYFFFEFSNTLSLTSNKLFAPVHIPKQIIIPQTQFIFKNINNTKFQQTLDVRKLP